MRLSNLKSFLCSFEKKALVLMYHRIHKPLTDPWDLSVSPDNFEAQLRYLKSEYTIISANELVQQLISGTLKKRSVVLTFDDGYRDNFETAKPLLEKYSVPATFFITDSYLGSGQSFWWDELEQIIVHTRNLPSVFALNYQEHSIHFDLTGEEALDAELQSIQTNFKYDNLPTRRTELYLKLWTIFSPLLKNEQSRLLEEIREWAGLSEDDTQVTGCMTEQEVLQLAKNPLFTIGGHTKTHPALASHSKELQHRDIVDNQKFLEKLINQEIQLFAYPSGNYDESTIQVLNESSVLASFTTTAKPVKKNTPLHEIPRFQVNNWSEKKFKSVVNKWFRL